MKTDGSQQRNLTQHPAADIHSTFSPDGRLITFRSNRSGKFEAYTMSTNGSYVEQLTTLTGSVRHPSFSPDGHNVIFHVVHAPGVAAIRSVNIHTLEVHDLTDDKAANMNAVWAPGHVAQAAIPHQKISLLDQLRTYHPRYVITLLASMALAIGCLWWTLHTLRGRRGG